MTYDPIWMKRAIRNAEKARGTCSPNPFVGAVIVKAGKVIADGWTQSYGSDHAEIHALKRAKGSVRGAEIYVTLEPCSHYGKTPPCAKALVEAGISKVYIGLIDPNPLVSGKGIRILEKAGIKVETGFFQNEIARQLEYFLCRMIRNRPFVIWKMALSLDGRFTAEDGSSKWITGELARASTHRLRSRVDVILTGLGTVKADDPALNCRIGKNPRQPVRAVIDPHLEIDPKAQLIRTAAQQPTLVFCAEGSYEQSKALILQNLKAEIIPLAMPDKYIDPVLILKVLHERGCYSVMLEAGSELCSIFLKHDLIDKVMWYYGSMILGGKHSILNGFAVPDIDHAITLSDISSKKIGEDILISGYIHPQLLS
ncbi:MAG TPA: bifunctional diaminohydroxyphosphoribosylaminopyrimidine deaminase/5-amino-6-(5-phosphoribosylamino)uracil reductase RibD [Candidatus Cloacimonadota bacterium]|nr:bifunctional diaminohydroxyphosphoribosylaminopyrimidine deaminase/5-amino-6-(5-phosphoribosylamino)uracil reductase RibD [Candidatus Cloacimonadota bacterium]